MPFLPPNEQRQITEGTNIVICIIIIIIIAAPRWHLQHRGCSYRYQCTQQQTRCTPLSIDGTDRRRTDIWLLHRPSCTCYAGSVKKLTGTTVWMIFLRGRLQEEQKLSLCLEQSSLCSGQKTPDFAFWTTFWCILEASAHLNVLNHTIYTTRLSYFHCVMGNVHSSLL